MISKTEAIKIVIDHLRKNGKDHAVNKQHESVLVGDIDKDELIRDFDKKKLNSAEEIELIQVGLDLGLFVLAQLTEEVRNLLGEP